MDNLDILVKELCKLPNETGWVEFKRNNDSPQMIGQDISALANSAVVADKACAYMVWGIADDSHEIVGTTVRLRQVRKGNQELESWLRELLSKNADFEFHAVDIDDKHVEILIVAKAVGFPVTFEKVDYIRIGSYTKKLVEYPAVQVQLWDKLRHERFEEIYALVDLQLKDVVGLLDCAIYFDSLHLPLPTDMEGYAHYLQEEGIIVRQDNGLYAITNLGAILFARKLSDFPRLERKAIRIVQYEGNNRVAIVKESVEESGYVAGFERVVEFVGALLPSKENIHSVRRTTANAFPFPAVREAIANSLIHQDFFVTGAGPMVELFENRVEVTNPGVPLMDVMRIVDNPPKSRNEKLAALMRRLGMCEELGRGWDRMVISCEMQKLPAPRIQIYPEATKVSLFSHLDFSNISVEDKLWSVYLHACIKFVEGDVLTNASLRERFGLKESSSGMISRLIKEALKQKLIKPLNVKTAPRYMKYVPIWG